MIRSKPKVAVLEGLVVDFVEKVKQRATESDDLSKISMSRKSLEEALVYFIRLLTSNNCIGQHAQFSSMDEL